MIYIQTVSKRGFSHPNWNEDNLYYLQSERFIIGGVFDGCSSGKDSYFASKLYANTYKTTIAKREKEICIKNFSSLVHSFFVRLDKAVQLIGLEMDEILSTAILFIYEMDSQELYVKFFGDGVAYTNNKSVEPCRIDEENQPDYIGYSLSKILETDSFTSYWGEKKSFHRKTKDFSISTDGIYSFKPTSNSEPGFEPESFLVEDTFLHKNPAALKRKLNMIKNKGYEHEDDVTVIRVIME
jgi:hypothetical protein